MITCDVDNHASRRVIEKVGGVRTSDGPPLAPDLLLRRDKPEFLINAAGYTGKPNVDACELHKTECLFGNAVFPGLVAQACNEAGVPWGHVSSGCIYTGSASLRFAQQLRDWGWLALKRV